MTCLTDPPLTVTNMWNMWTVGPALFRFKICTCRKCQQHRTPAQNSSNETIFWKKINKPIYVRFDDNLYTTSCRTFYITCNAQPSADPRLFGIPIKRIDLQSSLHALKTGCCVFEIRINIVLIVYNILYLDMCVHFAVGVLTTRHRSVHKRRLVLRKYF